MNPNPHAPSSVGEVTLRQPDISIPSHALTLHRPHSDAMVEGAKPIENRGWPLPTRFRGVPLALHAGQAYDETAAWHMERMDWFDPEDADDSPTGIIGVVIFDGVIDDQDRQYKGPFRADTRYIWCVESVIALPRPIKCPGRQGLWKLSDKQREAVRVQLARVGGVS